MALASLSPQTEQPEIAKSVNSSKVLAKCFGYMAIGLLVTAVVSFLVGYLFANLIFKDYLFTGEFTEANWNAMIAYFVIMGVSFVALMIDSFAMCRALARPNRSAWPPYIIYAVLMGVFLSSFLVLGIDFATIGEAAAISAVVFGVLFLIGYFSKKDLNFLAYIGMAFLSIVSLFGLFGFLLFLFVPPAALIYNLIFTFALAIVLLVVIAADAYNIKNIIARGQMNNNIALYCAFTMYSDFIVIFVRILYVLAISKSRD